MEQKDVFFRETQKFRFIILWIFLFGLSGFTLYGLIQQVFLGNPFGNNPASNTGVVFIFLIFGVGFPLFFYLLTLRTEVRKDAIYYMFTPLHIRWQKIFLYDIKQYEIKKYNPFWEYGGYGIRYSFQGKAYNVSGNIGIEFELNNGKRILIGTQDPEKFMKAINEARESVR